MMPALACLALPFLSGCTAYAEAAPAPAYLSSHRAAYNGVAVRVSGRVRSLEEWTYPRSGQSFTLFELCRDGCVRVYMPRREALQDGEAVTVRGIYHARVASGRRVYANEILAAEIFAQT